jgi:hypothetical protein
MKIRISQSGGFAGIPIELANIDTTTLPTAQAKKLERLVRDASFFQLQGGADTSSDTETIGADIGLAYEITVEKAGKSHTVSFVDNGSGITASVNDDLRALVTAIIGGNPT